MNFTLTDYCPALLALPKKRKVLVMNMKKTLFVSALCVLTAMNLAACKDKNDGNDPSAVDTDSSYYGVNYTDTGDSGIHNSSANIDHSSSGEKSSSSSSSKAETSSVSKSSAASKSSSSASVSSNTTSRSTSSRTTIITYYYYDDEGEHSTDTEVSVNDDTDSESSSETEVTSSENKSSTDTSTDTESDTSTDSDTAVEPTGEFTESDLVFNIDDVLITYDQDIAEIVSAFGEPESIDNIPNESNPEFDIQIYNYEKFFIIAAPSADGSVYTVSGMEIFSDTLSTEKGIHIGMTLEEAEQVYGKDAVTYGDEYRYYYDSRYMYLYVQNGIIANIGFGYDNELDTNEQNA